MTVRLRPVLGTLPAYVPGRDFPRMVKLASNETPYGPLPHVIERIAEAATRANRYPDNMASKLTQAIADKYAMPLDQVVVGCGSVALCQQLVQITCEQGDEVVFAWRSFEAYPIVTAIGGATAVKVPLRDYVHDLDAMAAAITDRTRLVFVCNPNNPTGTVVHRAELERFLDRVPPHVLVVLDEAYREFVTDRDSPDGLTLLDAHPNLIVLRTFSKAYGLAGLRVGYGVAADPALTTALRQVQLPFAVTQVAQEAALACLERDAEKQLMIRVDELIAERERVHRELIALDYVIPRPQGNFFWLDTGPHAQLRAQLFEQEYDLIVRPLGNDGVRITFGSPPENDKLLEAMRAMS